MGLAKSAEFRKWWDEDWSWDGLKQKRKRVELKLNSPKSGASLQDEWANEEPHLIPFAGRRWTRQHLPAFDPSGTAVDPKVWAAAKDRSLFNRLALRVRDHNNAQFHGGHLRGITDFSDLRGIVFPSYFAFDNAHMGIIADLSFAIFEGPLLYSKTVQSLFLNTIFCEKLQFDGAKFPAGAEFSRTTFRSEAMFQAAQFLGNCSFSFAKFAVAGDFLNAQFAGDTDFSVVEADKLVFEGSQFKASAHFENLKAKALSTTRANPRCCLLYGVTRICCFVRLSPPR